MKKTLQRSHARPALCGSAKRAGLDRKHRPDTPGRPHDSGNGSVASQRPEVCRKPPHQELFSEGRSAEPSVQARTVFQVVYADGYVMVDSGMDQQVHNFFGRGTVEPYDAEAARQVERAVRGARSILITHEHGDHVAGVIRTPFVNELASKTILTRAQVQTLLTNPQMPEIKLTPEMAGRYNVIDYDKYLPFGPGIVLIKAPGHTPGSQMIYVVLSSGREYLLIGDTAWHMDGVRGIKGKDAPWIQEDETPIMAQLSWLNGLSRTEKNLIIVASHDEDQRTDLIKRGILGNKLE